MRIVKVGANKKADRLPLFVREGLPVFTCLGYGVLTSTTSHHIPRPCLLKKNKVAKL